MNEDLKDSMLKSQRGPHDELTVHQTIQLQGQRNDGIRVGQSKERMSEFLKNGYHSQLILDKYRPELVEKYIQQRPVMQKETYYLEEEKPNSSQLGTGSEDELLDNHPPQGLPNVGNNCFLNSVIQFLFPASKFRQLLIKKSLEMEKTSSSRELQSSGSFLLGKLFYLLKQKQSSNYEKQKYLSKLMNLLEQKNLFYEKYMQQDASETMTNLLFKLDYSQKEIRYIKDIFTVVKTMRCKCIEKPMKIQQKQISTEFLFCSKCQMLFEVEYVKLPENLIIIHNNSVKSMMTINNGSYWLRSQIQYAGNGSYGHYTSCRVKKGKIYRISDNSVEQILTQAKILENIIMQLIKNSHNPKVQYVNDQRNWLWKKWDKILRWFWLKVGRQLQKPIEKNSVQSATKNGRG